MAYRQCQGGTTDSQPQHNGVSLADLAKVQLGRGNRHSTWRQMQTNVLEKSGDVGYNYGSSAGLRAVGAGHRQDEAATSTPSDSFRDSKTRSSNGTHNQSLGSQPFTTRDSTDTVDSSTTSDQASSKQIGEMRFTSADTRALLFGKLPDPIRLTEQTGEFDGQVVFIGHPNRDISAHQWSSTSFQWVNIGRYASSRGKVEGSLASDRLRGIEEPQDTLECFKLAAVSRQTLIVQYGRPGVHITTEDGGLRTEAEIVATSQKCENPPIHNLRLFPPVLTLTSTAHEAFKKHALEDPFVAEAPGSTLQPPDGKHVQDDWKGLAGSLDLTYRFPIRAEAAAQHPMGKPGMSNVKSIARPAAGRLFKPLLQEIVFGEETAHRQESCSASADDFQQFRTSTAYQRFYERTQLSNNKENSAPPDRASFAFEIRPQDTAVRHTVLTRPIASTVSASSALNAAAVPYAGSFTTSARPGVPESYTGVDNAAKPGLHYSHPDGLRATQQYEVVNGLSQQPPTPQNFHGPFFTESKPTTHDPTAALSIRINKKDELVNWFRDGHRPARQKEYTKSLVAAAAANDARHLGCVGGNSAQEGGPYGNTAPFVRMYENLSEYVEEYRNGSSRSYFTRGWKPANSQLRAPGNNSSASYHSNKSAHSRWPNFEQVFRPSGRSIWD